MNSQKGFSLVELMVVVAIIGILSAIAIPQYERYAAKAKQAEAKASLSALFTAEVSFKSEWSTFTGDMVQAGYVPLGFINYRVSNAAFDGAPANYSGKAYDAANATTSGVCGRNRIGGSSGKCGETVANGGKPGCAAPTSASPSMSARSFTSTASGVISPGKTADTWSITDLKIVKNENDGLP